MDGPVDGGAARPGATSWVRRLPGGPPGPPGAPGRPPGATPAVPGRRVVCFPHAGGAASWYAPLARLLAPTVDVVAVQYPGRQDRLSEPCLDSIAALRDAVVAQLLAAPGWLDRPVALFGHSMGAVVAYEVARKLEHDHGRPPRALFVSGRRAPSTHRVEQVHLGGDPALLREVARLGGTPPELLDDPDVHDLLLPALRGDYRAIETYAWRPGPEPGGPVWALVGDDDPVTTPAEAAAWRPHTSGPFERRVFPGRHFYLADPGPAAEVAALVRTALG